MLQKATLVYLKSLIWFFPSLHALTSKNNNKKNQVGWSKGALEPTLHDSLPVVPPFCMYPREA